MLKGVGRKLPYTLALFFIASLSMIGIPLLPGFISKWYLSLESIQANKYILIVVILMSSLLNAVYYFPISINGFFGEYEFKEGTCIIPKKNLWKLMPIVVLVVVMIGVGVFSKFILDRKSTRLNSSHANISYAVFCLKKK